MEQPIVLAGVPIHLEHRLEYLYQLARAFSLGYPELLPTLGELCVNTSIEGGDRWDKIERSILGYSRPADVYSLIVKDWADTDRNECDALTNYLDERSLLKGARTAYICGAGIGRLADYLGGVVGCERVVCSDLSWIALHLGRLLMQGQEQELPACVRRPRSVVDVDDAHRRIVQRTVPLVLKKPRITSSTRTEFEVRDAFAFRPVDAELILVCNFVESFKGRVPATLTAQITRRLDVGQKLLHVTWVSPEEDTGRRPEEIVELLRRCGFECEWLDFLLLPYSTNNWCIDSSRSEWKNLVVVATKRSETDEDGIHVDLNRRDAWLGHHISDLVEKGVLQGGGIATVLLTDVDRAVLRTLREGMTSLASLRRRVAASAEEFEASVARLTGKTIVTIQVDAGGGAATLATTTTAA